jgi:hypothetical protein
MASGRGGVLDWLYGDGQDGIVPLHVHLPPSIIALFCRAGTLCVCRVQEQM